VRRLLLLLALLVACGDDDAPARPGATLPASAAAPRTGRELRTDARRSDPVALFALRRYEQLRNGRREMTYEVRWSHVEHEGRRLVEDVTRNKLRTARLMGRVRDIFEAEGITTTLRTEAGELISMDTEQRLPSRTDRERVVRTATGYEVTTQKGSNEETFTIETAAPAQVDVETFLGPKIRAGEAAPGTTWSFPLLATGLRKVIEARAEVVGPDDEGPGLKVVQSVQGNDSLWWFDEEGAVVRMRSVNTVIRRDDSVGLDDLPRRPASWRVTLPSNVDLPRIFTGRTMLVDIRVETDETTRPPKIPPNPFTEVLGEKDGVVRARLKSYDDPDANTRLPIDPRGFEDHLRPTPLMEVDDPIVRRRARSIVGDEKDARAAATRIADFVFTYLEKGSPDIADPTAKQILANPTGDCSEHALLFTALCRAAGIPARRCSGYVCIGDDWGSHAWCEIWVGEWIGADPTTNEIGTRARYIFLQRPDDPDDPPGRITAERTQILVRQAEYSDGLLDLEGGKPDLAVFSGIRLGPLPAGWKLKRFPDRIVLSGESFRIYAFIRPDHGYRALDTLRRRGASGWKPRPLGGRSAVVYEHGKRASWIVPLGRQNLRIQVMTWADAKVSDQLLAEVFAPTLNRDDG
jgi:transglutaminase-like putative cysteine protease